MLFLVRLRRRAKENCRLLPFTMYSTAIFLQSPFVVAELLEILPLNYMKILWICEWRIQSKYQWFDLVIAKSRVGDYMQGENVYPERYTKMKQRDPVRMSCRDYKPMRFFAVILLNNAAAGVSKMCVPFCITCYCQVYCCLGPHQRRRQQQHARCNAVSGSFRLWSNSRMQMCIALAKTSLPCATWHFPLTETSAWSLSVPWVQAKLPWQRQVPSLLSC